MEQVEAKEKLGAFQLALRIVSVIVCGIGCAACAQSLSLQIADVGSLVASVCWFSGLGTVTVAVGGYVVTCSPRRVNAVPVAVVAIAAIAVLVFWMEHSYLWTQAIVALTLAVLVVEICMLVICHKILKREDPQAL